MKILTCFSDYEVIFIENWMIKDTFQYIMEFNRTYHKTDYYAHSN